MWKRRSALQGHCTEVDTGEKQVHVDKEGRDRRNKQAEKWEKRRREEVQGQVTK